MHPILFYIPLGFTSIPVPAYGAMLAIGFSLALFFVVRQARTERLDPEKFLNVSTYVILVALIGSRLFHVFIEEPSYYFSHPLEIPKIWKGGYAFYGGLIPAAFVLWWYFRKYRLPILKSMDIFAPYLALGEVFGRIGCFLAGCCHGKVCSTDFFPLSYIATDPNSFSRPIGVPLYATQIWQATGNFLIFLFLVWLSKRKRFNGQVLASYFFLYPTVRIFIEIFRGDEVRGFLIPGIISIPQFVSAILMIMGGVIWWRARKHPL